MSTYFSDYMKQCILPHLPTNISKYPTNFRIILGQRRIKICNEEMRLLLKSKDQSLIYKDHLQPQTVAKLEAMAKTSGTGAIVLEVDLSDGTQFEVVGFFGKEKISLRISQAERQHGIYVLDHVN